MSFVKRLLPARFAGQTAGPAAVSVQDVLARQYRRVELNLPPRTAPGKLRIHLFAGEFETSAAAWHYCFYHTRGENEALARELPNAYVDTSHVEVRFDNYSRRLAEFLLPGDVARVENQMAGANTLVIIAEPAFGGLAYALNDTSCLRYLGPMVVTD